MSNHLQKVKQIAAKSGKPVEVLEEALSQVKQESKRTLKQQTVQLYNDQIDAILEVVLSKGCSFSAALRELLDRSIKKGEK